MAHPLTPREKVEYWLSLAMDAGLHKQDFNLTEATDAILTALASGSGDHAELAKDIRKLCDGHPHAKIAWPHYELHALADRAESLLAENAALRAMAEKVSDGSMEQTDKLLAMHTRATEAERKLAEAVGLLGESLAPGSFEGETEINTRIRAFISKEAERG